MQNCGAHHSISLCQHKKMKPNGLIKKNVFQLIKCCDLVSLVLDILVTLFLPRPLSDCTNIYNAIHPSLFDHHHTHHYDWYRIIIGIENEVNLLVSCSNAFHGARLAWGRGKGWHSSQFFLSQHKDEDFADNAFRELGFVIIITYWLLSFQLFLRSFRSYFIHIIGSSRSSIPKLDCVWTCFNPKLIPRATPFLWLLSLKTF